MKNNIKRIMLYVLFLLIGLLIGSLGTYFLNSFYVNKTVKINNDETIYEPLYETYNILKENYYKDLDDKTLINGAINGMLESLGDKHSLFFDETAKSEFETELSGQYYGIGAQITQINENEVVISKIFDDSPAEKYGLKEGDIFVSIDGKSTKGLTVNEIASNLRSKKKEKATIVVNRDGKEVEIKVQKDNVNLLSVSSQMLDDNIGYISVSIFGEKTVEQFNNALKELESKNMKSLIIDLRGNSGGYLSTVTYMLNDFLDDSKVIYQMKTRKGTKKYYALDNTKRDYKVIILIDENSASASEIMCSAMKEQYGATLVGVKTYGKGTVQETSDLSNDTLIKYTVQEWLTSNGNSINDVGIEPDVEVQASEDYINNPIRENDNQLNKAIELAR